MHKTLNMYYTVIIVQVYVFCLTRTLYVNSFPFHILLLRVITYRVYIQLASLVCNKYVHKSVALFADWSNANKRNIFLTDASKREMVTARTFRCC